MKKKKTNRMAQIPMDLVQKGNDYNDLGIPIEKYGKS